MKTFKFIAIFCAFIFAATLTQGQSKSELLKAQSYLMQKGEVYFTFTISSKAELLTLTKIISIDNVKNKQVFAYANSREFEQFRSMEYDFTVLTHPGDLLQNPPMYTGADKGIWQFDTYPTYTEYESMMTSFATNYPNICKLVQIGTTVNGRKLLFVKISKNVNQKETEPRFMYTSSMHGDETTGYILTLRLINHLLTNYGTNYEVTDILDHAEIWVNPLANPDGTYKGGNGTILGATRSNGNNVDINRNYKCPDPTYGDHPDGNVYQPEVLAMMNFMDTLRFDMSANFHGGAEVLNFPWDTWTTAQKTHADDNWWRYISKEYVDSARLVSSSYMTDTDPLGYTEGADWYAAYGTRQDYFTYFKLGREITIECSSTKNLPSTQLLSYWNTNYRSLVKYMKEVMYGFRGIVTDACTGQPLRAKVFIAGHDRDSSHIYSDAENGSYFRSIYSGTYSLEFSANGYISQTVSASINNKDTIIRNIQLAPVVPVADFIADATTTCTGTVNFNCLTAGVSSWTWIFGDGSTSIEQNPIHTYAQNGTFTVSLTVGNCAGTNQVIKTNYIVTNISSLPITTNAVHCGQGSVNLSATATGTLYWFAAANSGNLLASGNTFTTPVLTQTTTYFVESILTLAAQLVGKADSIGTGNYFNTTTPRSLIFDCNAAFTLVSVKVYAGTAGNKTIELRDNADNVLQSVTVNVPLYESRVTLNFMILPGTGYQLALSTSNANLFRHGAATSPILPYPYTIANVVNITGNNANNPRYYYYFYDWEIQQTGCSSARVPATAFIAQGPVGGTSTALNTSLCSGNSTEVSVTGNTGSFVQWQQSADGNTAWINAVGGIGTTTTTFTTPALTSNVYYRAKITESGCTDSYSSSTQIIVNSFPQLSLIYTNISCFGASDGSANANVTSGHTPYSYLWSNGNVNANLNGLDSGTYSVTITDAATCSTTSSFTIIEPVIISIIPSAINATCGHANGSTSVVASGGTGLLTYLWSNGGTNDNIQNLTAGIYSVTVRDANNCIQTTSSNVGNDAVFNADIIATHLLCFGEFTGSAVANVTGGASPYLYSWSTGGSTNTETGLGAGIVFVTITDQNNCSSIISDTIIQPQAISAIINTTDASCNLSNGSASINATGGTGTLAYNWDNGSTNQSIFNLNAGQYYLTITDISNCIFITNVIINNIQLVNGLLTVQNVACYNGTNGSANVIANFGTPPYSYNWSNGSSNTSIAGLSQGPISVTITDALSCNSVVSDTVKQPLQIQISLTISPETSAGNYDGSAFANVTGGTPPFSFSWSNNTHSNSISGMPGGTYSLAIIDGHGCFATTPVVIDVLNTVEVNRYDEKLKLYPNPAKDALYVSSTMKIISAELVSITGQKILYWQPENRKLTIDVSTIAYGFYYIRIETEDNRITMKKVLIIK